MTIVVGIFDNHQDLDRAIVNLAEKGFEDTVFDESIVAQEMGVTKLQPQHQHALVAAFKKHMLKDYHVPQEVIAGYASSFIHDGKFVVVKTDTKRAPDAVETMQSSGASRVNRHD
jgi:hypothetical protein